MGSPSQNANAASESNIFPPAGPNRGETMAAWRKQEAVIKLRFFTELWDAYGERFTIVQAVLVAERAWYEGHSEGFERVESVYEELVEFYTEMRKAVGR